MKFLQIYLLFIVPFLISIDITKISANENDDFNYPAVRFKICKPLIPGLDKMQVGIDITELDFLSTDPTNSLRKQIFHFTCNSNLTWTNEIIGQEYIFPDQFENPVSVYSSSSRNVRKFTKGSGQYKASLTAGMAFGIDSKAKGAISSGNAKIKASQSKFFSGLNYVHQIADTSRTYLFTRNNRIPALTEDFIASVKQLPEKYTDDPKKYDDFIANFGTHYFVQATMGGRRWQSLDIEYKYVNSKSDSEIEASAEGLFNKFFKPSAGISSSKDIKELTSMCKIDRALIGGNQSYFGMFGKSKSDSFIGDWIHSLNKFPSIIDGKLMPIENLIKDPKKKNNLGLAINAYYVLVKNKLADKKAEYYRHSTKTIDPKLELALSVSGNTSFTSIELCVKPRMFELATWMVDKYSKFMDYLEALSFIDKQITDAETEYIKKILKSPIPCVIPSCGVHQILIMNYLAAFRSNVNVFYVRPMLDSL